MPKPIHKHDGDRSDGAHRLAAPVPTRARRSRRRSGPGFTLIEAALTTAIVGTGVLAIVEAQSVYIKKNDWAQRANTGLMLANELRELTLTLPMYDPILGPDQLGTPTGVTVVDFNNVLDFAGAVTAGQGAGLTFTPPINALRQQIPNMDGWSQEIKVDNVLSNFISAVNPAPIGSTELVRVTVTVKYQRPGTNTTATISDLVWLITEK